MQKEVPDLVYFFPNFFPEEKIKNELEIINNSNIKIVTHKNEESPFFNAFEWVIPTAFGVYILKPYFEGFLSEAGKDHYVLLKKFIGNFLEKGKEYNFSVIAAKQSSEKLSKKYNKSFSVSIEMQTKNDRTIKVLYDNSISVEEWKNASEEILNIFDDHYKNYPNDELTSKIKQFDNKPHRKLYITVDKFPQKYILKDDTEMMIEFKNQ